MARIFITGSADGLGLLAAKVLIQRGHKVVLHGRNKQRSQDALQQVSGAETALTADLAIVEETKKLAGDLNALGKFDAVIHNAGVYQSPASVKLAVNTLAPYILTCLIHKPTRLIYLSSGLHMQGNVNLEGIKAGGISYSDSKLHVVMLAKIVAREWPGVYANAVNPGWVPTKMGGRGAPDDLDKGAETQAWLAVSDDTAAKVSGKYFFHKQQKSYNRLADDESSQNKLLDACEDVTGIGFPK